MGIGYDESYLTYSSYSPTEMSWLTGDREVLCLIQDTYDNDTLKQSTGSLKGVKR